MENKIFDIGIIGGGPAGYTLAIWASKLHASVILFDKNKIGGTCLNKGCIPTKTILHTSNIFSTSKNLTKLGMEINLSNFNFQEIINKKNVLVEKLSKSLYNLVKSYDVIISDEQAQIIDNKTIKANGELFNCKNIVIATGSEPLNLPNYMPDNNFIFNSDSILDISYLPKSIVIIGSGAIGIEWARIFSNFNTVVTLVEAQPQILPIADVDVSSRIERLLKKNKVKIEKGVFVEKIENKKVFLSSDKILEPDVVLVAVGRKPVLPETSLKFEFERKFLKIDKNFQTNIKNVYAIGDVNGQMLLAHSASHQAISLGNYLINGVSTEFSIENIPSVIYGNPEIAWFGESEEVLLKKNINYKKINFPISALGKAHCDESIDGFIKILVDKNNDKILSASIVAPEASALLMQLLIAKNNDIPYTKFKNTIFPHPTYSEGIFESLLALDNQSLCLPDKEFIQ